MDVQASNPDDLCGVDGETVKLASAQGPELERRIEDYKNRPTGNIPWETIKSEALAQN